MKQIILVFTLLILPIFLFSQSRNFINKIFGQDSTIVYNQKFWVDLSFGPSLTSNPEGMDAFFFGPTIDFNYINLNYRLIKIKSSFHSGITFFNNVPQRSGEINLMTGKIKVENSHLIEFYYGIGVIGGQKRDSLISHSDGGANGFGVSLPFTKYRRKEFIFIGIPFEYKIQWKTFGLGIDGNLNPYLPYIGAKWFLKFGNKKLKTLN